MKKKKNIQAAKLRKNHSSSNLPAEQWSELSQRVFDLLARSLNPLKINEIGKELGIRSETPQHDELRAALDRLVEADLVRKTTRRRYTVASREDVSSFTGVLHLDYETSGYVQTNDAEFARIHIKRHDMLCALHGDTVEVKLLALRPNKKPRGEVVRIVERNQQPIAGTLHKEADFWFFVPDEEHYFLDFLVAARNLGGAHIGDKVLATVLKWDNPHVSPEAEIVEVLGKAGVVRVEFDAVVKEFRLPLRFSTIVEEEAARFAKSPLTVHTREDLRAEMIVTIDPDDARDFDDALSLRQLDNGNLELGVHIADVSAYVQEDSALDREALKRANSTYLVDRVIPMLPEVLSNNVCSLVPNEDRMAFSVFMEFTARGVLKAHRLTESVIRSKRRYTYDEVQKVIEGADDANAELLLDLHRFAEVLRKRRYKQGGIDFDTAEVRFVLDEQKNPVKATVKRRSDATGLVEECMLVANKTVTEHIVKLSKTLRRKQTLPFVYRIHDDPDDEKLQSAFSFMRSLGVTMKMKSPSSREINVLLEGLSERPEFAAINQVLLRSMAKARYSAFNVGHFGLGFEHYTHFTSPIRRYPDLVVHRLLKEYASPTLDEHRLHRLADELEEICDHCSQQERLAVDAERASSKLAQVLMASQHVGDELEGTISGVTSYGMFVLLDELYAEGLVHIREMSGDYYYYDEAAFRLVGRRSKEVFSFGKRVKVQILRVQLEKRLIDLRLVNETGE